MNLMNDAAIDAALEAYWNGIPCHVDWKEYLSKHPDRDAVLATHRKLMRAAIAAATHQEEKP
jgi:hypothetical protein